MNTEHSGSGAPRWLPSRVAAERVFAELAPEAARLEPTIIAKHGADGFCVGCGKRGWLTQPDTAQGDWANLREGLLCQCGLNSRMRQILVTLDALLARDDSLRNAVVFEQVTPLFVRLRERLPRLIGSEFLGPSCRSGDVIATMGQSVRHESLLATSYATDSLDLVMHFDVLEHVPDPLAALAECHRILRPGGWLFFTCPFYEGLEHTIVRARMVDGALVHELAPCFHGNPVNGDGALVFTQPGWDLLDWITTAGFPPATLALCFDPEQGIVTNACPYADGHTWPVIFVAQKTSDPVTK
ncbi:MAG: hypothetical protein COW59_06040 [Lysobacterales bacterium CG17_big_fil_post_rev_8_21_14_2_50_64_11]|nr:MAG: hypothetical protein COW59_06040 [Xanthomonadales bacterium CG17_big_fil_post_rev_8_21_14_2_50_64_11]PIX61411.1 MAG: hypothetical protein COZ47_02090 [Xanthomonadales bacterium CG_4_10_14_3_um_filter_64_11]